MHDYRTRPPPTRAPRGEPPTPPPTRGEPPPGAADVDPTVRRSFHSRARDRRARRRLLLVPRGRVRRARRRPRRGVGLRRRRIGGAGYDEVCSGRSGHAEVVRIEFDPALLSFRDLLTVFFTDPRPDDARPPGQRRRSAVSIGDLPPVGASSARPPRPSSGNSTRAGCSRTRSSPRSPPPAPFWPAEVDHQEYFARNGGQPYCAFVVAPKVAKFRKHFVERLKRPAK